MVNAWHRFIDNVPLRRFAVLALLIWVLYLVRGMLSANSADVYLYIHCSALGSLRSALDSQTTLAVGGLSNLCRF